MGEKEAPENLAKLYQGGATLAKTSAETGPSRFAVRGRTGLALSALEKIFAAELPGVIGALENGRVTPQELTLTENLAPGTLGPLLRRADIWMPHGGRRHAGETERIAQKLVTAFGGDYLKALKEEVAAGKNVSGLAARAKVSKQTLRAVLVRHQIVGIGEAAVEVVAPEAEKSVVRVDIFDLVGRHDSQADSILDRFAKQHLDPQKVAAATDQQLKILGFTPEEIAYMRKRLKKRQKGS